MEAAQARLHARRPAPARASPRAAGARSACRKTCGRLRSQRASPALASAVCTEPAASASNMSLTMFSAVSRSISSAFLSPTAVWFATAPQQLGVLVAEGAPAQAAAQQPELLVAGGERRREQPLAVRRASLAAASLAAHHVEQQRRAPGRGVVPRRLGRVGRGQHELVGLGVEPPDLAGVGAEQLARAARDGVVQILAQRHGGERLAQPRERGQRVDAPARLLVELGVLDRAGRQRGRVDEEVEHVVVELARRLGVQDDHPDHARRSGTGAARPPSTGSAPPRAPARTSCAGPRAPARG